MLSTSFSEEQQPAEGFPHPDCARLPGLPLTRILDIELRCAAPVAQHESTDLREEAEDFEEQRFRSRDDLCRGAQHDSWPKARRARHKHPRASILAAYFSRVEAGMRLASLALAFLGGQGCGQVCDVWI